MKTNKNSPRTFGAPVTCQTTASLRKLTQLTLKWLPEPEAEHKDEKQPQLQRLHLFIWAEAAFRFDFTGTRHFYAFLLFTFVCLLSPSRQTDSEKKRHFYTWHQRERDTSVRLSLCPPPVLPQVVSRIAEPSDRPSLPSNVQTKLFLRAWSRNFAATCHHKSAHKPALFIYIP